MAASMRLRVISLAGDRKLQTHHGIEGLFGSVNGGCRFNKLVILIGKTMINVSYTGIFF